MSNNSGETSRNTQIIILNAEREDEKKALLLADPALSLPNMLVIGGGIMGAKKTEAFCGIIVGLSTIADILCGSFAG